MSIDLAQFEGLSQPAVLDSQKIHGLNILSTKEKNGVFYYLGKIFREPLLLLLLAVAILYYFLGNAWDGTLMIIGVLLMMGLDLYQENKTDRALEALKELSAPRVTVIRGGVEQEIVAAELAVGDLMLVREGQRVAGDGIIRAASNFSVDESLLTGEPGAMHKQTGSHKHTPGDTKHLVFSGTLALSGEAVVEIKSIGPKTKYGRIGTSLGKIEEQQTPLQKHTGKLVRIFGFIGLLACFLIIIIYYIKTGDLIYGALQGLTLAISVLPEELPVIITVFSALGAYRLAKKQSLIRHIGAIETIGHVTTLCTDKTGTLTENRMTLQAIVGTDLEEIPANTPNASRKLVGIMRYALLGSQPHPYDPMDQSIHAVAERYGINIHGVYDRFTSLEDYAFDSKLRFLGQAWRSADDCFIVVKGSAEAILDRCGLDTEKRKMLNDNLDMLAARGFRMLALAKHDLPNDKIPRDLSKIKQLEFIALLAFTDPPRHDAKAAVKACRAAGITVRMITGDHPQTALHIAKAVGINIKNGVITGSELDQLSEQDLTDRIDNVCVFARILPEQKLKIVDALKRRGEIVAMIGDGINDAPSLKAADIGLAMGERGTNVAREAADIILLDDSLSTTVHAIKDGRRIYDNIQKAIGYVFSVHTIVILSALMFPLIGLPPLMTPLLIVLFELIIDPTCALVFEAIPAEPDSMLRPPLSPTRPLISWRRLSRVILVGLIAFLVTAFTYITALQLGVKTDQARTMAFSVIFWSNLFIVLAAASHVLDIKQLIKTVFKKTFVGVYALMAVALIIMIYVPGVNARFGFAPIPYQAFLLTILLGSFALIFNTIYLRTVSGIMSFKT